MKAWVNGILERPGYGPSKVGAVGLGLGRVNLGLGLDHRRLTDGIGLQGQVEQGKDEVHW